MGSADMALALATCSAGMILVAGADAEPPTNKLQPAPSQFKSLEHPFAHSNKKRCQQQQPLKTWRQPTSQFWYFTPQFESQLQITACYRLITVHYM
jgi:hypothetical protein